VFLATVLLYPCVLAALCAGAGLAVDRCCGRFLPAPLLLSVGAAALIALSQLSTYVAPLAPATPYLMLALALAGFALARGRLRGLVRALCERPWPAGAAALVYAIALAPVLLAGRPSFSSYMALADSAVHMLGADFLIRHGQDYAHLDLRNSYGQFVHDYYATNYPSGADTMFGGSAFLLGLPLIWAFQPFNAFMLAVAAGPAWLLARRMGLAGGWAALATLAAVLPALVYAYELFASVKEITALSMILTLGCLAVLHRDWLARSPIRAVPFALVLGAGVSALGVAFGVWALAAVAVLAAVLVGELLTPRGRSPLPVVAVGAIALLIAAWPTWRQLSGSVQVAQSIASTGNSGNLHRPLRAIQVFGVWLEGSYKLAPAGAALTATHVLIVLAFACALIGAAHLLRIRAYVLAAWLACMLLAWLVVSVSVTTWAAAKTLMLTSPVVVLLTWGAVAALLAPDHPHPSGHQDTAARARPPTARRSSPAFGAQLLALALALAGGVLASDALQYHSSNLAPTARYQELASLDARFAGKGPTLFTDFDEYSLYELRDLDVGGPDFVYPPAALAGAAGGYGHPVELDRVAPSALLAYQLIVARRDPAASRPPAAYRLAYQGSYYQVWRRRPGIPAAAAHVALAGSPTQQCTRIAAIAAQARETGERLVAAQAPELIRIPLRRAAHPARWGHEREGLVMSSAGRLSASFALPSAGAWDVWVQGQIMPAVKLSLDGRQLASIAGQLDGNSLVPDTVPPIRVTLSAGEHRLSLTRPGFSLAPGDGGAAVLDAIFLTPARTDPRGPLRTVSPAQWQRLCGRSYQWIEITHA